MNDYLSKPINRSAALSCIARWTEGNTTVQPSELNDMLIDAVLVADSKQQNTNNEPYVDEKVLLQLVEDTDAEIVPELIMLYIEDSQQRIERKSIPPSHKKTLIALEFETHTIGSSAVAHGNAKLYGSSKKN